MIGTESKWEKQTYYMIKSDMGEILQKKTEGSVFKFHQIPYQNNNCSIRSDNATFIVARTGRACTISTSKMDNELVITTGQSDEMRTLNNMTEIIKEAIAIGSAFCYWQQETRQPSGCY
jgi:hypothetical protein